MPSYSAILLSLLPLAAATALPAQEVIKPRSTPALNDRLPKPALVIAAQQPNGRIRVAWKSVEGATRYKVIRSVPPSPSQAVTLPNPSDTQYVDADVKPGSTYYYVVSAVNAAGLEGLRAGSAPVTATAVATPADTTPVPTGGGSPVATGGGMTPTGGGATTGGGTAPADTTPPSPSTGGTSPAPAQVPPPTNVAIRMFDYLRPQVSWQTSVPGARAVIERREILNGSVLTDATWVEAVRLVDQPWPCSTKCTFTDERPVKVSGTVQYRVTVVEPAPSTRRSEPVTTEEVFLSYQPMEPTEIHDVWLVKGETQQLNARPRSVAAPYVSSDTNVVSLWSPGVLKAKEYGKALVTTMSTEAGEALKFWVWRVTVGDKPQ